MLYQEITENISWLFTNSLLIEPNPKIQGSKIALVMQTNQILEETLSTWRILDSDRMASI